ncbi:siderophore-interacting protein [Bordetella genomosp. 4]|uniref:NADPH-dependent ferric siderophore reductase n=1 Tax=Bordetella genomosp. 4 TaxID=463044 RepID=A0A261TT43_9BORD|nr:siderophore-interacting protein [Bordetella genomosp. 4]OZI52427.1 NADPH-dependent ferric siderophore reductase [Bordetella genomosp. 4]
MDTASTERYAVQKVRHPLKSRMLQVSRVQPLSAHMVRITLTGNDLEGFVSASFDDHVKVFLPEGDALPIIPTIGPNGPEFPAGVARPQARDYTPRRYRPDTKELDVDFVLHDHGPAGTWAAQAQPGQHLGVAGPRGSFVIPHDFDWHLLIGDETALPAIARRLEELPAGKRVLAVIETRGPDARIDLPTQADATVQWINGGTDAEGSESVLERVIRRLQLPEGEGYIWAAGESAAIRGVRQYLVHERGIDKARIRASAYWRRGNQGAHEVLED